MCPGCEWFEPYIGHKSCGLTQGRETTLDGCRAMWTNRTSVGSPDFPLQEHVLRGFLASLNEEDGWDPICGCLFSQLPTLTHALLTLWGRSTLEQGLSWSGRQLGFGKHGCIWPRATCGWKSQGHSYGGHLHRQHIRRSPDHWGRPDCNSRWPSMFPGPMRASPTQ